MVSYNYQEWPEFDNHEQVVAFEDPSVGLRGFIVIHATHPSFPSLGATRLWSYENETEALLDALRLSRLMSYKSALAGLPYGGAKAVLMHDTRLVLHREALFQAYARQIELLEGRFVTGTDVGVEEADLWHMKQGTSFVIGNGVNAGYFTALGVWRSIQVVIQKLFGSDNLRERRFAIQGLGKTGMALLKLIEAAAGGAQVVATDLNPGILAEVRWRFPNVKLVDSQEIYDQPVDIFCPCALGGVLNEATVPRLKCRAIVGSANNQLSGALIGEVLARAGILYAPDYLVNAGGLISVVDQYENKQQNSERVMEKLWRITEMLKQILNESRTTGETPESIADRLARQVIAR